MRSGLVVLTIFCFLLPMSAERLPACERGAFTRRGNRIDITAKSLSRIVNRRLTASHSRFKNVQVMPAGNNDLRISGEKEGTSFSIQGPAEVTSDGKVQIHADKIKKNGNSVKDMMGLFGKSLSDYVKPKANSIEVHGNDLLIDPDQLLGLKADLRQLRIQGSTIELMFAATPCR